MVTDNFKRWEDFGGRVGIHCRNCEDRHVGCHSTCEKYLEAKDKHDTYTKRVQRSREESMLLYRHKIQSMQKEERKRKG